MSMRRASELVGLLAVALLVLLGAWREHRCDGVEMQFLAFVGILLGPAARRVCALLYDAPPPPRFAIVFEVLAFTGLATYPIGSWAYLLAAAAWLAGSAPALRARGPETTPWPARILVPLALVGSLGAILAGAQLRDRRAMWAVWPFLCLLLETIAPYRIRNLDETLRRASGFAVVGAGAALHTHLGFRAQEAECLLLGLTTILAFFALSDVIIRLRARGDLARLYAQRRRVVFGATAWAFVLAVLWAGGELAFRFVSTASGPIPIVNDGTQPFHSPGRRFVYAGSESPDAPPEALVRNEFVWNGEGFHDLDHEHAKRRGRVRVALVGDSFVEGTQLRLNDLLHRRLEPLLARATPPPLDVETLAFGYSGWGQIEELDVLRTRAIAYSPDLVLLEFLPGNDVANDYPDLETERTPSWPGIFSLIAARHGLLFAAMVGDRVDHLVARAHGRSANVDEEVFKTDLSRERARLWEEAWLRADTLVGDIAATASSASSRLVVIVYPGAAEVRAQADPASIPKHFDFLAPARRMTAICARRSIPCLDLTPRFARLTAEERTHLFLLGDGHWSSVAHARAAEEVARFLVEESTIWREIIARAQAAR